MMAFMNKPRVLVVDDYAGARYRRMRVLTDAGQYEVVEESLGRSAVTRATEGDIDLVLLDLFLPDISGLEVCGHLKRDAKTSGIPIVLVSAVKEEDEAHELARTHGASAFVADSADGEALLAAVGGALANLPSVPS